MLLGKRDLADVMILRWEIILNDQGDPSVTIRSLKAKRKQKRESEGDVKNDRKDANCLVFNMKEGVTN